MLRAVARRPRVAPPEGAGVVARAAGGRHAVVHDALRSRHADHLAPDDALRTGARDGRARALAALQATEDDAGDRRRARQDPPRAARRGKAAESWFPVYYGTVDATPLFLVLLSEVWRWTGDDALVRELEPAARAALAWMDDHGDLDGDGFVEYARRAPNGLANQSWKDSGDSQQFRDGRLADGPIAPAEVQGYVYDARLRLAELAREVWRDPRSRSSSSEAPSFATASIAPSGSRSGRLCAGPRRREASRRLASNNGHLLWSGIVPDGRIAEVTAALCSDELWSGWGIRTMGAEEAGYNPLGYHTGTVWPHDTALAAWGLERVGEREHAWQLSRSLLEAARFFDHSLPEVFAGYPRTETAFPVAYPTAAAPRPGRPAPRSSASACCSACILDPSTRSLATRAEGEAPDWLGGLTLQGGGGVRQAVRREDCRSEDRGNPAA